MFVPHSSQLLGNKVVVDSIRSASSRCGFDEQKISKLISIVTGDVGSKLHTAYKKEVIKDYRTAILNSSDYDKQRFPAMAAVLH